MAMTPRWRKLALTAHVTSSVGSLGAVGAFLALAVAGLTASDAQMVRAAYLAMDWTAWYAILPLIHGALLTGLVMSLGTSWGLFRHYWVLIKFLLTVLTIVVLLLQLEPIAFMAERAAEATFTTTAFWSVRSSLVWPHAAGGLLVLLAATALSVFKPEGVTRYGWRKQHEARSSPRRAKN